MRNRVERLIDRLERNDYRSTKGRNDVALKSLADALSLARKQLKMYIRLGGGERGSYSMEIDEIKDAIRTLEKGAAELEKALENAEWAMQR